MSVSLPCISIIVAMANDQVIGLHNGLPWHLPNDFAYFKKVTMGKPVIMGRKTHDAIGRVLPGRHNIILSRRSHFTVAGATVCTDLATALSLVNEATEVFIIGGATLYREALSLCQRLYITRVHCHCNGDTCFPAFDQNDWLLLSEQKNPQDARHAHAYDFLVYSRKRVSTDQSVSATMRA